MKFELKTENENYQSSFLNVFRIVFIFALLVFICDVALKIRNISKYYQINFNCMVLSVEKSTSNFKKLSKLTNLKNKQRIWEFCRQVIK